MVHDRYSPPSVEPQPEPLDDTVFDDEAFEAAALDDAVFDDEAFEAAALDGAGAVNEVVEYGRPEPTASAFAPSDAGFDRDRLIAIVDRLERDIALVEGAMDDLERHDEPSLDAAFVALGVSPA